MDNSQTVAVITGASGFIGMYCMRELLGAGYCVRGTLRSLDKEEAVRKALAVSEAEASRLSFVVANLLEDDGWTEVMKGATYVLHVASPVPAEEPKDEQSVIRPAREGTLRVLRAASEARVSRVVVTSSVAAILAGHDDFTKTYSAADWSDLEGTLSVYEKSKTLAERAAWDFVGSLPTGNGMEMVAVNPVFVIGPSLLGIDNASNELVGKLMRREIPGSPRLRCHLVDVRDTAHAHLLAMTVPEAAGKRFILSSAECWFGDIARCLKDGGYNVPTRILPNWAVRLVALFDKTIALAVPGLGRQVIISTEGTRTVLGWQGRGMPEMVLETAESMAARY